jgi:hypothetical protein
MGLRPTKAMKADVAHALVRAVFALLRTQSCENKKGVHTSVRGTLRSCTVEPASSMERYHEHDMLY